MENVVTHCSRWLSNKLSMPLYHSMKGRVRGALRLVQPAQIPLHQSEGYAPFFIVGSGRAGTTLLRRILQEGKQVHIPPEIWSFRNVFRCFLQYRCFLGWNDLVPILVNIYINNSDFDDSFKGKQSELIRDIVGMPEGERSLSTFIDRVNKLHGEHRGATFVRWGDKTPLNSFCLQEIVEVFPDAKFIHLVRDGADVVYSYVRHNLQPNLEEGACRWKSAVHSVQSFQSVYPDKVIEARYEDLVRDPKSVVGSVCEFLNIDFAEDMLRGEKHSSEIDEVKGRKHHENVFMPISSDHIGKGRRRLGDDELRRLDELIGRDVENMGYKPLIG